MAKDCKKEQLKKIIEKIDDEHTLNKIYAYLAQIIQKSSK